MKIPFKIILVAFFAWFVLHITLITVGGLNAGNEKAEFAVILGTTVERDGSLSARLKARLDAALKLYQQGMVEKVYVSGGLGKEGHYEGTKMKEYLVSAGIDSSLVYVDNKGLNTRATALNFKRDFPGVESVVVVSQFFHVSRCKLAFNQIGVEHVSGAHASYYEWRDVYSTIREFFGYYWYLIFYS